jgi:signal transduction histidine kinase
MSKLWPSSLFGRLVVTLTMALMAAQLLGAAILFYERAQSVNEAIGFQFAEHMAALVALLNTQSPEQRTLTAAAFESREFHIVLNDTPMLESDSGAADAPLRALFRRVIGGNREVRVHMGEESDAKAASMSMMREESGMNAMMHRMMGTRKLLTRPFQVQVRLDDGTWMSCAHHLPGELISLPYRLLASLLILLASVILISIFAVKHITRPLNALADAADALGQDIGRAPLAERGPREVSRAARAFNAMQARLARYVEDRSRMLAAISHDLKTPITRLRLRAALLKDLDLEQAFSQDLDEMEAMVEQTLEFMRDSGASEAVQKIDVDALLQRLIEEARLAGQDIRLIGKCRSPYAGRPLALKRCLTNLIDNASRYGGTPTIDIDDTEATLRLRVVDQGPGIPEDQLEQVFEPFFRLEKSRSRASGGTGLGLAIARNIARGHGGDLYLRNRPEGGLEAVLELPRSA